MEVPFVDLRAQYQTLKIEIRDAISEILDTTSFIGGPPVAHFERDFASLINARNCLGVANGTDAIFIALKALGIGAGDQVITAANSFIASGEAISMTGAQPLFVDADPTTYTMDVAKLEDFLRSLPANHRVRAIVPVHLYGCPAPMPAIMKLASEFNLRVVEDCAQAHLAMIEDRCVGTFGDVGCFSFYPGKNLGAYGDAGAVVTDNNDLAIQMRKWANHGRIAKYDHEFEGVNSRLDGLQAAVLSVKMPHLQRWTEQRIKNAALYQELLAETPNLALPQTPRGMRHVFHLYVVRVPNREQVVEALRKQGISTGVHYPIALPSLKAYAYLGMKPSQYPVAHRYQNEILSLPMYPELSAEQIEFTADQLKKILSAL
jgi:dTDP-4-amino-4,6-dideoxygalactose transaminase